MSMYVSVCDCVLSVYVSVLVHGMLYESVCMYVCGDVGMCVHMCECVCARVHKGVSIENKNSKKEAVFDGVAVLWRDWNGPGPETN